MIKPTFERFPIERIGPDWREAARHA